MPNPVPCCSLTPEESRRYKHVKNIWVRRAVEEWRKPIRLGLVSEITRGQLHMKQVWALKNGDKHYKKLKLVHKELISVFCLINKFS